MSRTSREAIGLSPATVRARPASVTAAAVVVAGLAVWTALLSIGHLGVEIPLVSSLGPGGNRVVREAGIAFAIATVACACVAIGLARMRPWAWTAGIIVNSLALVGGVREFRGAGSVIGILLAAATLILLLTPQARHAFTRGHST
jgi:hypothetical protein